MRVTTQANRQAVVPRKRSYYDMSRNRYEFSRKSGAEHKNVRLSWAIHAKPDGYDHFFFRSRLVAIGGGFTRTGWLRLRSLGSMRLSLSQPFFPLSILGIPLTEPAEVECGGKLFDALGR